MSEVEDYLKTARLYADAINLIYIHDNTEDINPDDIRRALDRIFNQGKIIGRRTALAPLADQGHDALIEGWQRCVNGGTATDTR